MKRIIKFRVWDAEEKTLFQDGMKYLTAFFDDSGELYVGVYVSLGESLIRFELSQFTGLKDKNGKEIYEGDIIKTEWPKTNNNSICVIEYINGGFMGVKKKPLNEDETIVQIKNDPSWPDSKFHITKIRCENYCEIIGNIYENPELLK